MCAQAAAQQQQPKKQKKGVAVQLNFTELEDLFLNTKGKALRNLRKKVDKYRELEKTVKKGEIQPNSQQKSQIQSVPSLNAEIAELEALCKLYIESNPGYDKKTSAAPAISEDDMIKAVTEALEIVGKAAQLTALLQEDSSFVECTEGQRASMLECYRQYKIMNERAASGSAAFGNIDAIDDFAVTFTKLARSSNDIVKGSCTFGNLKDFINAGFNDNAQILQRIADKDLQKKREKQAADEEAAKKAAEVQKAQDADIGQALGNVLDDFDVFGSDYGDEVVPAKPAPKQEAKPAAAQNKSEVAEDKKTQEAAADTGNKQDEGEAMQDSNQRGGRGGRGGRRGDGEWRGGDRGGRGRRGDGEWRGGDRGGRGDRGRGDRGRGRGGFRQPKEDEDGFVMETGEKPKPRIRGGFRGRRGDGEWRGGDRGGRGDRGGDRGDRGGDWGRRGGRGGDRGGRPQTADGGDNGAAAQEQQPAAQTNGAQASTNVQGQV